MLAGITLDTKNFAVKTGVRTFEAAAYLRKRGAKSVDVSNGKFSEKQIEYYMKQYKFSDYEISLCSVQNDFPKDIEFITL